MDDAGTGFGPGLLRWRAARLLPARPPDGLRPFIVNWEEVALYFLRGVQADAIADGTRRTAQLLATLSGFAAATT